MKLSEAAADLMEQDLAVYDDEPLLAGLARCRREVKHRLTLADIIERIDDGRPSADEAWAQVGTKDENLTIVTTTEAMEALGSVRELLRVDEQGARMGFRASYQRLVLENRAKGAPVTWTVSPGKDRAQLETAIADAAKRGRISEKKRCLLLGLPAPISDEEGSQRKALPPRSDASMIEESKGRLAALLATLGTRLSMDRQAQRDREPKHNWRAEEARLQPGHDE